MLTKRVNSNEVFAEQISNLIFSAKQDSQIKIVKLIDCLIIVFYYASMFFKMMRHWQEYSIWCFNN